MTTTDTPVHEGGTSTVTRPARWLDSTGTPSTPSARHGRRELKRLLAGLVLVLGCAAAGMWWMAGLDNRISVLALTRPVAIGQTLTAGDLRAVDISTADGVTLVPADHASTVLGRPMATNLGPGALLTPASVGVAAIPAAGQALTAIAVKAGQFPPELSPGAPVSVIVTAAGPTATSTSGGGPAPGASWPATVVSVSHSETEQTTVVSLSLDTGAATALAQVPSGQLALVLQAAGGAR
ncbi:SAF domain-containing protein [Amycolatopsis sp. cmx-4-68]|uniref:SAF domain-containing protein n=1 Tax=Amycolatopsis sp. cmx-4-68 TaxID=2790938 RepID=UPI003978CF87